MKQLKVQSTNYRHFNLLSEDQTLAGLAYTKWYSFKAEITLADKTTLALEPKGFWDAKIELKKGEEVLMNFKLGWKGIVINVMSAAGVESYLLKHKGILSGSYVLIDTADKEMLAVKPDFNWSTFKLDYMLEVADVFEQHPLRDAFLLTVIHAINYQLSVMAGAG